MTSILDKIKNSDLFLVSVFLILGLAPIPLKLALTGSMGPMFNFYFFIVWIPALVVSLAILRGWKEGSLTSLIILGTLLISLINYPTNPAMDFHRQLVHQADIFIVIAALASIALQVVLRRRRVK